MYVGIRYMAAALLLFIMSPAPVDASDDSFRCGNKIVSLGNRKFEVLTKCGEPSYKDVRLEKRIKRDFFRDLRPKNERERLREPLFVEEFVEVEEWVYNFGSTQFLRYLRFENSILVDIETGDYGF